MTDVRNLTIMLGNATIPVPPDLTQSDVDFITTAIQEHRVKIIHSIVEYVNAKYPNFKIVETQDGDTISLEAFVVDQPTSQG